MTVQDQTTTQGIILSDAAAVKVSSLLEQEGRDDLRLRIAVQPGGCSGLRYQLFFDERTLDGDRSARKAGKHGGPATHDARQAEGSAHYCGV